MEVLQNAPPLENKPTIFFKFFRSTDFMPPSDKLSNSIFIFEIPEPHPKMAFLQIVILKEKRLVLFLKDRMCV